MNVQVPVDCNDFDNYSVPIKNPNPTGTRRHEAWEAGFNAALTNRLTQDGKRDLWLDGHNPAFIEALVIHPDLEEQYHIQMHYDKSMIKEFRRGMKACVRAWPIFTAPGGKA